MTTKKEKDIEEMESKISDGIKMVCMMSKMCKKDCMGKMTELNTVMKLATILAVTDKEKALKIVEAGKKLEKTMKKYSKNMGEVVDIMNEISNLTEDDEKRLTELGRKEKNKMLSKKDNDMLNKLFEKEE